MRRYLRSLLPRSSGHLNACPAYYYTYNTQIRLKSSKTDPGVNSWRGTKLIQLGIHIKGVTPEKFPPLPSLAWLLAFMESFLASGAPNENIVQNHLNIALLNVF